MYGVCRKMGVSGKGGEHTTTSTRSIRVYIVTTIIDECENIDKNRGHECSRQSPSGEVVGIHHRKGGAYRKGHNRARRDVRRKH